MLMRPNDRAVDHRILVIGIGRQMLEDLLPDAGLSPAAEPLVGILPVAEALRQIAPGDPGSVAIEHRLDESTVVFGRHADMASPAWEQVLDPFPLVVTQSISCHWSAFCQSRPSMNHTISYRSRLFLRYMLRDGLVLRAESQ
jgi:hypothetical protein